MPGPRPAGKGQCRRHHMSGPPARLAPCRGSRAPMGASAVSVQAKPFEEMSPLGSVMLSNSKNIKHVPGLSHLRAYAALLVLCYHARGAMGTPAGSASNPFWRLIVQGHTGVSLFLVLSGFVFELGARD